MKNTKKNVIELLKKMSEHAFDMAMYYEEDNNKEMYNRYMGESMAYDTAIDIVKSKEAFANYAKIFHMKEEG